MKNLPESTIIEKREHRWGVFWNWVLHDRQSLYVFLTALFVNIIMWLSILIKTHGESKPIPLHFNAFYGIELVGSGYLFLQLPLIGLVLLGVNVMLGGMVYSKEILLARLMCYGSLLIQTLLMIATLAIIAVNS